MTRYAINLESVSKQFRKGLNNKIQALTDVSLKITEGEAFGFIGANGAGKSTTIKIITGALRADSGVVQIFGCDASNSDARKKMGYVPESPYLYDYLTPFEILQMGVKAHKSIFPQQIKTHCIKWLERFEIAHVANKTIRGFSKGMMQRTALAHAMAIEPRLLILDEPLSGLDPLGRQLVVDCLSEYKNQGGSIFFSSHVLHDVERLADRFALIHHGKIRKIGLTSETSMSYTITCIDQSTSSPLYRKTTCNKEDIWLELEKIKTQGLSVIEITSRKNLEEQFIEVTKNA